MEMMDYIKEQCTVLRKMLAERAEDTAVFRKIFINERPDHIYLIASGTSRNAASVASYFMEDCLGIEVSAKASSDAGKYLGRKPMLVFISQGGNSTNTISAIERSKDYLSLAITGSPDGVINNLCPYYERLYCGPETAGPKTKGYTATILQLYLAALGSACECGIRDESYCRKMFSDISETLDSMDSNISKSIDWVERNRERLMQLSFSYIIGKGLDAEVADEAALKIMETLLIPANGYIAEEFLHGPSASINKGVSGIYFMPPETDAVDFHRYSALASYHRDIDPNVFIISGEESDDERDLQLRISENPYMRPFEYIIPAQVMSALVPSYKGKMSEGIERFEKLNKLVRTKAK